MLLLPFLHSVLINHILFSANLNLTSGLFSIEIHVITDNLLTLASERNVSTISILKSFKCAV